MSQSAREMAEWDNPDDVPRERECNNQCGHYDEINRFCWIGWFHVSEGDPCRYGLKEEY